MNVTSIVIGLQDSLNVIINFMMPLLRLNIGIIGLIHLDERNRLQNRKFSALPNNEPNEHEKKDECDVDIYYSCHSITILRTLYRPNQTKTIGNPSCVIESKRKKQFRLIINGEWKQYETPGDGVSDSETTIGL